ncbi:MAG: ABC transporter permease [Gordonia sp.]|nr:ABC transporter permease [Gordonia sp. (in: high G+C Gram-positive bacteria)]
MTPRILWRVLALVPILFIISVLTFLIGKASPGDPIKAGLNQTLSADAIDDIRSSYGLDLPLREQYWQWVKGLFSEGGGRSITQGSKVFEMLSDAFVNTLILTFAAIVISVVFGVAIGTIAALNHNRFVDRAIMLLVQIGSNLSIYWFGLILIWVFAIQLKALPSTGMYDMRSGSESFTYLLFHLILPGFSAALMSMLILARFARAGVIDSLESDYLRTFRSQGVGNRVLIGKHVMRNVAPTILNTTGLEIGTLLSGAIFVEFVFNWPGLGAQLVNAIGGHDYPVIQGGVLLVTVIFVLVNLSTDIIQDLLNPRLRS